MSRYFVLARDRREYGPADVAQLAEWVVEGRVRPDTLLRPEGTGATVAARTVPGLPFPPESLAISQIVAPGASELRNAWICVALGLFGGLIPCARGMNVVAPLVGLLLVRRARRVGASGWKLALGALLIALVFGMLETFLLPVLLARYWETISGFAPRFP